MDAQFKLNGTRFCMRKIYQQKLDWLSFCEIWCIKHANKVLWVNL